MHTCAKQSYVRTAVACLLTFILYKIRLMLPFFMWQPKAQVQNGQGYFIYPIRKTAVSACHRSQYNHHSSQVIQ